MEGILNRVHYGDMIQELCGACGVRCALFYLDVSLAETLRRHCGRSKAAAFGPDALEAW
jgi:hypothetical protein